MRKAIVVAALALTAGLAAPAWAGPYPPPETGAGKATPSRVKAGGCTTFSGDGFAPSSAVAIADDGASRGTTETSAKGDFKVKVCFADDARTGDHTLSGTGPRPAPQPGEPTTRIVYATVTVTGVAQSSPSPRGGPSTANTGPTTRVVAAAQSTSTVSSSLLTGLTLLALLPLATALLIVFERRYRRRRRTRAAG